MPFDYSLGGITGNVDTRCAAHRQLWIRELASLALNASPGGLGEKNVTPGVSLSLGTAPGAAAFLCVLFFGAQSAENRSKDIPQTLWGVGGMEGTPWKCPAAHCPGHARVSVLDTLTLLHHTWNSDLLASQGCAPSVVGAGAQS